MSFYKLVRFFKYLSQGWVFYIFVFLCIFINVSGVSGTGRGLKGLGSGTVSVKGIRSCSALGETSHFSSLSSSPYTWDTWSSFETWVFGLSTRIFLLFQCSNFDATYSCRVRNEGEFWMSFDDFAKQFSHLDLVHIGPDDWMSEPALHRF